MKKNKNRLITTKHMQKIIIVSLSAFVILFGTVTLATADKTEDAAVIAANH